MGKVIVSFSLDGKDDRDILDWLARLPRGEKSAEIRAALRAYAGRQGVTLSDVYRAVQELDRKLDGGLVTAGTAGGGSRRGGADEPAEAVAALEKLVTEWKT